MSILNNNGVISYEDYVTSENEHDDPIDPYEFTSSEEENEEEEEEEEEEEDNEEDNEEKKDDYETEEDEEEEEEDNEEDEEGSQSDTSIWDTTQIKKTQTNKDEIKFITNETLNQSNKTKQTKIIAECGICADVLNKSNRKEIKCLFCNYVACRNCYEQYLLQSNESICMNCKAVWNREFMDDNFTKVFMKGKYKKKREDILMEKQKLLLQSTLPIAEIRKQAKTKLDEYSERKIYLNELFEKTKQELRHIELESHHLRRQLYTNKADEIQAKTFVKKCPNTDCRGFLSTRWKCGLCNINVCAECHEIKTDDNNQHVCKPENVETAKLLEKDCKNCPKCATYIYKISGCSQMFCTNCQTAFSWKTGIIETGRIHNPHYYEWVRKGGKQQRELLDIPCGGIPQVYNMRNNVEPFIYYEDKPSYLSSMSPMQQLIQRSYMPSLYNTIRLVTHIQEVELRTFQEDIERIRGKELDLRCEYLMNEIDENQWKVTLQQNEYKLEYITNLSQLFQMFSTVGSDIILYIYNTTINSKPRCVSGQLIIEKMDEIYELIAYFNNQSLKLAKRFNKNSYVCIQNYAVERWRI